MKDSACLSWQVSRCARIAGRIEEISEEQRYREGVAALKVFKGIETLIALTFLVEIGDLRRFSRAEQFMAFLGLVPSERSSGNKRRNMRETSRRPSKTEPVSSDGVEE